MERQRHRDWRDRDIESGADTHRERHTHTQSGVEREKHRACSRKRDTESGVEKEWS